MRKNLAEKYWKAIIVTSLAEPLKFGSCNGSYKESLNSDDYEKFCALEMKIADQIFKR